MTHDPAEISSGIKSFFELSAVPGSFVVNGEAMGIPFVSIQLSQLLGLSLRALDSLAFDPINGRSLQALTFPMLTSHVLLSSVPPDAAFEVRCSGTDCGSVWCVPQKISRFNFGARYGSDGLNLSVDGTIESPTAATGNARLLLPPGGFEIRANVPWEVLPYLFDRTPPFFEEHRKATRLGSNEP